MKKLEGQTCQCKVGLLILRDCEASAKSVCAKCKRLICARHTVASQALTLCPECALQQVEHAPAAEEAGQRRAYYHRHDYHPIYYGHTHYFTDYDARPFESAPISEPGEVAGRGVGIDGSPEASIVGEGGRFGGAGAEGSWTEDAAAGQDGAESDTAGAGASGVDSAFMES
jgi:hypothetical protein